MTLSYKLAYQETILVHPTRRQIFAGKPDSAVYNIWDLLIYGLQWSPILSNSNWNWKINAHMRILTHIRMKPYAESAWPALPQMPVCSKKRIVLLVTHHITHLFHSLFGGAAQVWSLMTKIQKVMFDPSSKIWDCLILLSTCLLPCAELHPIMDTIITDAESIRSSGEPTIVTGCSKYVTISRPNL